MSYYECIKRNRNGLVDQVDDEKNMRKILRKLIVGKRQSDYYFNFKMDPEEDLNQSQDRKSKEYIARVCFVICSGKFLFCIIFLFHSKSRKSLKKLTLSLPQSMKIQNR